MRFVAGFTVFILLFGFFIGPGEYAEQKLMEKNLCAHQPKPEYCGKEIK